MNDNAARAPRLTTNRLADLSIASETLKDEIEYLEGAAGQYPKGSKLNISFTNKRDALIRARDWLNGKVVAETSKRAEPTAVAEVAAVLTVTCDVCDAILTGAEDEVNPRWGQDLCNGCAEAYTEANPAQDGAEADGAP